MSLIDIAKISHSRFNIQFSVRGVQSSSTAVDHIAACLVNGGWTTVNGLYASATLSGPFGWGFTGVARIVCTIEDVFPVAFWYYDPLTELPPHGKIGNATIVGVPKGDTDAKSQDNLAAAITAASRFNASSQDSVTILLIAKAPGTGSNGINIVGQSTGSISVGSVSGGGGSTLVSQAQEINTLVFYCDIRTRDSTTNDQRPLITFRFGAGYAVTMPLANGDWQMVATPYQAVMFTLNPDTLSLFSGNWFIWACAPVVPDNTIDVTEAGFVSQPNNNTSSFSTLGNRSAGAMVVDMDINGTHYTGDQSQRGWSIFFEHSEGGNIVDLLYGAIFQEALVMLVRGAEESHIVGYIPDCFVSSIPAPMGQEMAQDGYVWRVIATQNKPPGCIRITSKTYKT